MENISSLAHAKIKPTRYCGGTSAQRSCSTVTPALPEIRVLNVLLEEDEIAETKQVLVVLSAFR